MAAEKDPKAIKYLHYLGLALGVVSAGIIIKTYFDNRRNSKTQADIANMQKELLAYQLKDQRDNHNFEQEMKSKEAKDFMNFRNFSSNQANNFSYAI